MYFSWIKSNGDVWEKRIFTVKCIETNENVLLMYKGQRNSQKRQGNN